MLKKLLIVIAIVFSQLSFAADTSAIKNVETYSGSFTRQEVYWMYTMRTRFWPDGTKISVMYREPTSSIHEKFCREVLNVSPVTFDKSVSTYLNTGNAAYFRQANSELQMYKLVSTIQGSIGYISEDTLLVNRGGYVEKISITD